MKKSGDATKLDQITRADAAMFRQWLASRLVGDHRVSFQTVAKHIRLLNGVFGTKHGTLKLDLIPCNPFDKEQTYTVMGNPKSHPDLTPDQIVDLLDACNSSTWRSLVAICVYTGARVGETFILSWDDIKWGQGKIILTSEKITGSKPKRRTVMMVPELEKVLLEGFESGDLKPVTTSKNNLNRDMILTIERAGLEPWREPFQALRRWRDSTWKLVSPEYVVDSWLGHGAEVSRKHYLTVPDHLYRPLGKLDRIKTLINQLTEIETRANALRATMIFYLCNLH